MWNRRVLLAALPAMLVAGRGAMARAGEPGVAAQAGFQAQLAPFWDQLAMLPSIRQSAIEAPSDGVCYMFTNKDCAVCQVVHKQFPAGFRRLEMRYIIYPYPGESYRELNHMYRPETTLADFAAYMDKRQQALSGSGSGAQADLIMAVAADMASALVEGGAFGTPFFFHAVPGATAASLIYSAGDIVAMGPLLDRAA